MNHTKLLKKENEMEVVTVDPKKCDRWKLADRSSFEFGDMYALAQDILKNGQIEPVILRKSPDKKGHFEVIAGSRRWMACFNASIPLKGIIQDLTDTEAAIVRWPRLSRQFFSLT